MFSFNHHCYKVFGFLSCNTILPAPFEGWQVACKILTIFNILIPPIFCLKYPFRDKMFIEKQINHEFLWQVRAINTKKNQNCCFFKTTASNSTQKK